MLTSVLIGGVAWLYSDVWKPRQEERHVRESLLTEIDMRQKVAQEYLRQASANAEAGNEALDVTDGRGAGVFSEFDGRTMTSLLWQLSTLVGDTAIAAKMQDLAFHFVSKHDTDHLPDHLARLASIMKQAKERRRE